MQRFSWIAGAIGGVLVAIFVSHRYLTGAFEVWASACGGAGAILLGIYLWFDRDAINEAASSRGARYSSMAALLTALALGVVVALNVLGDRYDQRYDATGTGLHTLSEQSVQITAGLEREISVLSFFPTDSPDGNAFRDLVEGYQEHTDKITFQEVDPVREPLLAREYEVTSEWGTAVLVAGDDQQRLEMDFTEEPFTNALVRLESGEDHVICFTTGHGELDVDDELSLEGIGGLILKLEGQNYTVRDFLPAKEGGVPADCEVVVIPDPQYDLLAPEVEAIARYVASGGALVVMIDPVHAAGFADEMQRFGIDFGEDIVLEDNPNYQLMGGDASYLILDKQSYDFHPVVNGLNGIAILRVARSVSALAGVEGINVQEVARTSASAWGETDILSGTVPTPDGADRMGPVPLMVVAEVIDPTVIPVREANLGAAGRGLEGAQDLLAPDGAAEGGAADPADAEAADAGGAAVAGSVDGGDAGDGAAAGSGAAPDGEGAWRVPGGRVVAFGDTDFISNELLIQGVNQDLFLNTLAWLVGEEDQIAIRSNEGGRGTLMMTEIQGAMVWLICLLAAPGLAAGGAFGTWRRRRQL